MSKNEVKIYRCLRAERVVSGGLVHDECADIIMRNPEVKFNSSSVGVEVNHMVFRGTNWDVDCNDFPRRVYLNGHEGRMGNIIVSIRLDLIIASKLHHRDDPCFYQPDYMLEEGRCNWYITGRTTILRVRIEEILDKVL